MPSTHSPRAEQPTVIEEEGEEGEEASRPAGTADASTTLHVRLSHEGPW